MLTQLGLSILHVITSDSGEGFQCLSSYHLIEGGFSGFVCGSRRGHHAYCTERSLVFFRFSLAIIWPCLMSWYCCRQGSSLTDAANSALAVERLALAHSNAAAPEGGATQDVLRAITRPVLAQMDGHEGSIHRCSLADELVLC